MDNDNSAKITIKVTKEFKREVKIHLHRFGYDRLQEGYLELLVHGMEIMKKNFKKEVM